jgi:hypothetical protein
MFRNGFFSAPFYRQIPACFTLILLSWLASCGPARLVNLQVTRPAAITFPAEAKNLVLVDRTKPDNQAINILEGIITGEMPEEDRIGAQEAVNSLNNELQSSPRFKAKMHPNRLSGNSLTAAFPQALEWPQVQKICNDEKSDVLLSLEVFDTDFVVTNGNRIKKRTEGTGPAAREVEYTEYYAQGVGNVKMGIRVYYPKAKTILDQQIFSETKTWEAVGKSVTDAVALLINKVEANRQLARMVAADYAYKISPMPVWVSRSMYGKSKHAPALEAGRRYADVGQWPEAVDTWKNGIKSAAQKDAGKLAYNTAVGYEVLGDFEQALQWARDAYTRFGNSFAREYVQVIEQRIQEENLLKQQMGNKK